MLIYNACKPAWGNLTFQIALSGKLFSLIRLLGLPVWVEILSRGNRFIANINSSKEWSQMRTWIQYGPAVYGLKRLTHQDPGVECWKILVAQVNPTPKNIFMPCAKSLNPFLYSASLRRVKVSRHHSFT